MNYAALSALIQSTTQNYDTVFVGAIPDFVRTAERRIYMEAKLPANRKTSTGTSTVIGSRSLALPTDYITGKALELTVAGVTVNLLLKGVEYLTEMYPTVASVAQPKFYAQDSTTTVVVAPTPDQIYPVTFHYFAVPPSIVTASTTWLGDNFDHVLLYGALIEAYTFMKGSADVLKTYQDLYVVGLTELRNVSGETPMPNFR